MPAVFKQENSHPAERWGQSCFPERFAGAKDRPKVVHPYFSPFLIFVFAVDNSFIRHIEYVFFLVKARKK